MTTPAEKATWLSQFYLNLGKHTSTLNISFKTYDDIRKKSVVYSYVAKELQVLEPWAEKKKSYRGFIDEYLQMETYIFNDLKNVINQIQDHPAYTDTVEQALGTLNFERLMDGMKPFTSAAIVEFEEMTSTTSEPQPLRQHAKVN